MDLEFIGGEGGAATAGDDGPDDYAFGEGLASSVDDLMEGGGGAVGASAPAGGAPAVNLSLAAPVPVPVVPEGGVSPGRAGGAGGGAIRKVDFGISRGFSSAFAAKAPSWLSLRCNQPVQFAELECFVLARDRRGGIISSTDGRLGYRWQRSADMQVRCALHFKYTLALAMRISRIHWRPRCAFRVYIGARDAHFAYTLAPAKCILCVYGPHVRAPPSPPRGVCG